MALDVSPEMQQKLINIGDQPILDSVFVKNKDGTSCEKTQGTKGLYISSQADAWTLRGPFDAAL